MSYPVTGPEDWESIRRWYDFAPERIDLEQLKRLKALQKEGTLVVASMPGGFDEPRGLMGEENLCYAFYDEPEMIHDMLGHMADTCLKVFERVLDFVTIDVLSVHEDMAGKTGPLAGNKQVREFIAPYYRKVWEPLKAHGCRRDRADAAGDVGKYAGGDLCHIRYPFHDDKARVGGDDRRHAQLLVGQRIHPSQ